MTAKRIHFTELALGRLTQEGTYWDTHTRAFGLRVGKTKKTLFIVRSDGSRQIVGHYPLVDLKAARRKAQELLLQAHTPATPSFKEAFETYKATYLHNYRDRSRKEVIRLIEKHCAPFFPSKLSDIHHREITHIFAALAPSEANHLFGVLRTFFTWCEKRDLCTSPMKKLDRPHKSPSRSRILTDHELVLIWRACSLDAPTREAGVSLSPEGGFLQIPRAFAAIVQLLILTGQRRSEIANIQRSWITLSSTNSSPPSNSSSMATGELRGSGLDYPSSPNLCTLTIPKEFTKNGSEHQIPLGVLAASILMQSANAPLLFPARGAERPFAGWSKSKAALDKLSGVTNWTLHDLRRTAASNMARIGISLPVIEKILNHRSGSFAGIVGVYQRHQYREEMRDALERYERFINQLVADSSRLQPLDEASRTS